MRHESRKNGADEHRCADRSADRTVTNVSTAHVTRMSHASCHRLRTAWRMCGRTHAALLLDFRRRMHLPRLRAHLSGLETSLHTGRLPIVALRHSKECSLQQLFELAVCIPSPALRCQKLASARAQQQIAFVPTSKSCRWSAFANMAPSS